MAHLFDPDVDDGHCSRPRLRSRDKTDKFSHSSTISSSDDQEFRMSPKKKKAGRPIAYKGDPDSKALTESERRKIKRRIANRESARRVRAKRAGTLEELQIEMDRLTERNSSLLRHVAEAEDANAAVKGQIQEFYQKLRAVQVDNNFLQQQTAVCQKQQKVHADSVDALGSFGSLSKGLCGDSQELLLDGLPCGLGMMRLPSFSPEDMACMPYLDNFDSQRGQNLLSR